MKESKIEKNALQTYQLLYVAQQDLSHAAFFAEHLREMGWHHEPWEVNWKTYLHQGSYVTAMVISYSRPFTDSRGWPKFPKRILRVLDLQQRELHERLLALRNEVYAHSDLGIRNVRPIKFNGKPSAIEALPPMRFSSEDLFNIRRLIMVISVELDSRLVELSKEFSSNHYG